MSCQVPTRIVVSVASTSDLPAALESGADLIELRLDLIQTDAATLKGLTTDARALIITVRSSAEGGAFSGTAEEWWDLVRPWCETATFIDLERRFAGYSQRVRKCGTRVLGSTHLNYMPSTDELETLRDEINAYADCAKIIVTPQSHDDVLTLATFTQQTTTQPICTGVLGEEFRFARILLSYVGSALIYCHAGTGTAAGQYQVEEVRQVFEMF